MKKNFVYYFVEFLMTYGWEILAVLVVVGALFYFGVFNYNNIESINKIELINKINRNYGDIVEWQCSRNVTVENYTVVMPEKFDLHQYCYQKITSNYSFYIPDMIRVLNYSKKIAGINFEDGDRYCTIVFADEIKRLSYDKPRLEFYNTTYCVEEKLVLRDIRKNGNV